MNIIIISILIIYSSICSYILMLSLRRINNYESFILQISDIVEFATEQMKKVDTSGHYESDDETAFFFNQLKSIQILLDNVFENEPEELDAKKEK